MKSNLAHRRCAPVFAGTLVAAVVIAPTLAQTTVPEPPLMVVGGEPAAVRQRQHRPVEFRYDAHGHKIRDPASNAAVTSAFSGYQAGGAFYTQASQQWTVPNVVYGQSTGTGLEYSSFWVGIQGNTATLVQLGTEQEASSNGGTRYYAWYELYPASEVQIPLPVYPGDIMSASVTCAAPCVANTTQTWTLWMRNTTQGWTWTKAFSFNNGPSNYTEWIMEAPYSGGVLPLADYNIATFATVTANNVAPSLSSGNGLVMQDPYGQTSNIGAYQSDGFVTCWGYGSMTPCGGTTPAAPAATLSASPQSIQSGQSSTLTWGSTNASSCTGNGFSTGDTISGSAVVAPSASTTYSLTCTGSGGSATANTTVTLQVPKPCHGRSCK